MPALPAPPDAPAPSPRPRLAAIVPAYNEGETLGEVLAVLKATAEIDEILVVSDGSTDGTPDIARRMGVHTLHLERNQGKGKALAVGVQHTTAPLLLFVDSDLLNLTTAAFAELVAPVIAGRLGMNIGVRNRGRVVNALQGRFGPLLSGIRCLRREVFEAVPEAYLRGFRIETALNWVCRRLGYRVGTLVLYDLEHRVKEEKRGLVAGARGRVSMFTSVFAAWLELRSTRPLLRTVPAPPSGRLEPEYLE